MSWDIGFAVEHWRRISMLTAFHQPSLHLCQQRRNPRRLVCRANDGEVCSGMLIIEMLGLMQMEWFLLNSSSYRVWMYFQCALVLCPAVVLVNN